MYISLRPVLVDDVTFPVALHDSVLYSVFATTRHHTLLRVLIMSVTFGVWPV